MTTKEPLTRNLLNRLRRLKRKYNISQDNFNARIAEHSTQLKALTAELRNRTKRIENKQINKQFKENPRQVYRNMLEETIEVENPPEKEKLEEFWRPLFETPKEHKENKWVQDIIDINKNKPEMTMLYIDEDDITDKLKTFSADSTKKYINRSEDNPSREDYRSKIVTSIRYAISVSLSWNYIHKAVLEMLKTSLVFQ